MFYCLIMPKLYSTPKSNMATVSVKILRTQQEAFDRLFPKLMKLYLRRAIVKAIRDPAFFDTVFFDPYFGTLEGFNFTSDDPTIVSTEDVK